MILVVILRRNLALYYEDKKDIILAEKYFKMAYENIQISIDLLDFHYGKFLIENGDKNKGLKFLKISKEKGEPEAVKYLTLIKS